MKKGMLLFLIICMGICIVPLAGMAVHPTTVSTENRRISSFPSVRKEDGALNKDFFKEFNAYFNDHFAFRNELVYADARIQADVFRVSAVESVIAGTDGWLYYTDSRKDYLGEDPLTEGEVYGLARNLYLADQFARSRGASLAVAIPPNKNTLYGGNMPYYDNHMVTSGPHAMDRLLPYLKEMGVRYTDLGDIFRKEGSGEPLYLKRDSHWNNKGALLGYNAMMDALGKEHDSYESVPVTRKSDEYGDLNRMLYTLYGQKEMNYYYDIPQAYTITNGSTSVEDMRIETENAGATGTLVMFRDSFGNALVPLVANQFAQATFTKETVYALERQITEHAPECILFEKAERSMDEFLTMPPFFSAMEIEMPRAQATEEMEPNVEMATLEYDINYYKITGSVESRFLGKNTDFLVQVNETCYEAMHTGEDSFALYLRKDAVPSPPLEITILTRHDGIVQRVQNTVVS